MKFMMKAGSLLLGLCLFMTPNYSYSQKSDQQWTLNIQFLSEKLESYIELLSVMGDGQDWTDTLKKLYTIIAKEEVLIARSVAHNKTNDAQELLKAYQSLLEFLKNYKGKMTNEDQFKMDLRGYFVCVESCLPASWLEPNSKESQCLPFSPD